MSLDPIIRGTNPGPLRKDEVYERLGFSMPAEGDEVFEGGADQPFNPGPRFSERWSGPDVGW